VKWLQGGDEDLAKDVNACYLRTKWTNPVQTTKPPKIFDYGPIRYNNGVEVPRDAEDKESYRKPYIFGKELEPMDV